MCALFDYSSSGAPLFSSFFFNISFHQQGKLPTTFHPTPPSPYAEEKQKQQWNVISYKKGEGKRRRQGGATSSYLLLPDGQYYIQQQQEKKSNLNTFSSSQTRNCCALLIEGGKKEKSVNKQKNTLQVILFLLVHKVRLLFGGIHIISNTATKTATDFWETFNWELGGGNKKLVASLLCCNCNCSGGGGFIEAEEGCRITLVTKSLFPR